jgi:hypothetical protein
MMEAMRYGKVFHKLPDSYPGKLRFILASSFPSSCRSHLNLDLFYAIL